MNEWGGLPLDEHVYSTRLDHARGGWFSECSCGWRAKRATYYKARSVRWAERLATFRKRPPIPASALAGQEMTVAQVTLPVPARVPAERSPAYANVP